MPPNLKLRFDGNQPFQIAAVQAVVDLFDGQPRSETTSSPKDIRLFVKLPRWFVVDTPVGSYNPDWAIVKHDDATVYMVRETKGTKDFRKRRGIENDKVACGERHFQAIGVPFDVATRPEDV